MYLLIVLFNSEYLGILETEGEYHFGGTCLVEMIRLMIINDVELVVPLLDRLS